MKKTMRKFFTTPFSGFYIAFKEEPSMLYILLYQGALITPTIMLNKLNEIEIIIAFLLAVVSLMAELINTSIEATVDLATSEIHPLAKKGKDASSAAQFMISSSSLIYFLYMNFIR